MPSVFDRLVKKNLIKNYPGFMKNNIHYEVYMGSAAYGVSDDTSDLDVYGFCIPPKDYIFPHLRGEIEGFGSKGKRFEQYQKHHIWDRDGRAGRGQEYDMTIYSIVKYFSLCMDNNPNMIDSLFVPRRCILHSTQVGEMVRENRHMFLHKGAWYKFKGYAYSQIHKMRTKVPEGKRVKTIQKFGYDVKFAYHTVRLLNEIEQILTEGELELERNREQLKAIRRGEWKQQQVEDYFNTKERELEALYTASTLPPRPDEEKIKKLLLNCLEQHYGSLDICIVVQDKTVQALRQIYDIVENVRPELFAAPRQGIYNDESGEGR